MASNLVCEKSEYEGRQGVKLGRQLSPMYFKGMFIPEELVEQVAAALTAAVVEKGIVTDIEASAHGVIRVGWSDYGKGGYDVRRNYNTARDLTWRPTKSGCMMDEAEATEVIQKLEALA